MRLINTGSLVLEEYFGDQVPPYAILSHTWCNQEASHQEWKDNGAKNMSDGVLKVKKACSLAAQHSLQHLWIDTICINKESSAELSEAINSMFAWYRDASICFAYIDDYRHPSTGLDFSEFAASRWFTRGWTLQELLAPKDVQFFDKFWNPIGRKLMMLKEVSRITSIHHQYLLSSSSIRQATVSRRMSWISGRRTTRQEDIAYCMLGLFDINMPLLYGEGPRAFIRLQEEIIKYSNDHTIFCWNLDVPDVFGELPGWYGCLCPNPNFFRNGSEIMNEKAIPTDIASDYQLTNNGLRISLPFLRSLNTSKCLLAVLSARRGISVGRSYFCLLLQRKLQADGLVRSVYSTQLIEIPCTWVNSEAQVMYIAHERVPGRKISDIRVQDFDDEWTDEGPYAVMPLTHNKSVQALQDSPITLLQCSNGGNTWVSNRLATISKSTGISLRYEARICGPGADLWEITVWIDDQPVQQHSAPLWSEFTIDRRSGPIYVRPVLVAFPDDP